MKYFIPLGAYRKLGVKLAGGSDHMIGHDKNTATNPYNPFLGMWTSVTRKMTNGQVLHPERHDDAAHGRHGQRLHDGGRDGRAVGGRRFKCGRGAAASPRAPGGLRAGRAAGCLPGRRRPAHPARPLRHQPRSAGPAHQGLAGVTAADAGAAVTFVGVGAIGLPMALRIQRAGFAVTGVDVSDAVIANAKAAGIATVRSLAGAPPAADVVVVMVATPEQLAGLVGQVADRVRGQTWIVMSTVGPQSVREQGEILRRAGARVVDAPVTGGVARAKTGALVIFAAGAPNDIAAVGPVLEAMGTVQVTGEKLGDGQSIKVVNQHLCSVHIAAAAEALNLARLLGLDPKAVLGLVEQGAAGSWMLSDRGPRMLAATDVEVTSAINIFVKDSGLVASAGASCGAPLPLLAEAHERFRKAADMGLGSRDDSRVIETWA